MCSVKGSALYNLVKFITVILGTVNDVCNLPTGSAGGGSDSGVSATFDSVKAMLSEDVVKSVGGVFLFDLKGRSLIDHF